MKILTLDIETTPNLAWVWGIWDQTVPLNMLESTTDMLCFAAKWTDDRTVHFFSEHKHGRETMVNWAWKMLDDADVVVHYNGTKFDIPHLNREFAVAGMSPPAPYQQIDLLKVARQRFRFPSNKLQHVSTALGLEGKAQHEGFDLWRKCMTGDAQAWKRMEKYNRQDVKLTEALYYRLLPWIHNHPSRRLYDDVDGCPTCGSDAIKKKGYAYTKVSRFQRWLCKECGSQFRSGIRDAGTDLRGVTP